MARETTPVVRAEAKWLRMSARKARLVTAHIRGRSVPEARTVLLFSTRAASVEIEKVLRSAVANAAANHGLPNDEELYVKTAYVNEGPTIKRWRARARGRVNRINKRTCHVTIELAAREGATQQRPRRAQGPATAQIETPAPASGAADKPKRASRRKQTDAAPAAAPAARRQRSMNQKRGS
jgi:large subunit ribosomal protein L22